MNLENSEKIALEERLERSIRSLERELRVKVDQTEDLEKQISIYEIRLNRLRE